MSLQRKTEKKRIEEYNHRKHVMKLYLLEKISRTEAGFQLNLSPRQVSRIAARSHTEGIALGTLRRKRATREATRSYSSLLKEDILRLVSTHYADYGPTLAAEKLLEKHDLRVSVETMRQWMIQAGLREPVVKKIVRQHPLRARRACRGELIQIDGSLHPWFEGRGPKCTLLVMVDDATSEIMHLECAESESFESYSHLLIGYMRKHGKPRALYSDKHSVFSVNSATAEEKQAQTHFNKALNILGIESILAGSPQAKGRVERMNKTLQDRLVKFFREHNVGSIDEGNALLEAFQEDYNRKKAKTPESLQDLHIPLSEEESASMNFIFRKTETRVVPESLVIRFDNKLYRIINNTECLKGQTVTFSCCLDGDIVISGSDNTFLEYEIVRNSRPLSASGKELEVMSYSIPKRDCGVHVAAYQAFCHSRNKVPLDIQDIPIIPPSPSSFNLSPLSF